MVHSSMCLPLPAAAAGALLWRAAARNVAVGSGLVQQHCHDTMRITLWAVDVDRAAAVLLLWWQLATR
jgi:hypothetical protein